MQGQHMTTSAPTTNTLKAIAPSVEQIQKQFEELQGRTYALHDQARLAETLVLSIATTLFGESFKQHIIHEVLQDKTSAPTDECEPNFGPNVFEQITAGVTHLHQRISVVHKANDEVIQFLTQISSRLH